MGIENMFHQVDVGWMIICLLNLKLGWIGMGLVQAWLIVPIQTILMIEHSWSNHMITTITTIELNPITTLILTTNTTINIILIYIIKTPLIIITITIIIT